MRAFRITQIAFAFCATALAVLPARADSVLEFEGKRGPGKGKTVVLIGADEEYRSEETMPQFARILSERHGFRTIVLFAIDPKDGTINPNVNTNIPGLENLKRADLLIMLVRWRNLPEDQM